MKKRIKQCLGLIAAIGMIFFQFIPILAGGGLGPFYDAEEPGRYDMVSITLNNPGINEPGGLDGYFSGPDVSADGSVHMVEGETYNFTWTQTYTPSTGWLIYGSRLELQLGHTLIGIDKFHQQIPIDGATLFGFQRTPREITVNYIFTDVTLLDTDVDLTKWDEYTADPVKLNLDGKITIEINTTIDGTYSIPPLEIDPDRGYVTSQEFTTIEMSLQDAHNKIQSNSTDGITYFDTPQPFKARIELEGDINQFGGDVEMDTVGICDMVNGTHYYYTEFQNQSYSVLVSDQDQTNGSVNHDVFSIDCTLFARISAWHLTLRDEYKGDSGVDIPNNDQSSTEEPISHPAKAALITAGTAVTALFGSILVSLVGDSLASAASASAFGAPTIGGDDEDGSETSGAQSEKDAETSNQPDLPEENSPEVSMSLFSPDDDLLNVKGGAADITIQIEGGEGYTWNYIPVVDCPGASKAIIPTVTGRSHLATLVLGMTGAKQDERCIEVNVHLIAWTTTPDGKVLKASESMELKLYERGIEAQREKDGTITVTAYCDTTLKGYADIRKLSADEYTMNTAADGTVHIQAKNADLGFTVLKPETEAK